MNQISTCGEGSDGMGDGKTIKPIPLYCVGCYAAKEWELSRMDAPLVSEACPGRTVIYEGMGIILYLFMTILFYKNQ